MIAKLLRGGAVLLAIGGLMQPSFDVRRPAPLPVHVRATTVGTTLVPVGNGTTDQRTAAAIARRLSDALGAAVSVNGPSAPAAMVLVGDAIDSEAPMGVPVSIVSTRRDTAQRTAIVAVHEPPRALPGWESRIAVELDAAGMQGRTSAVVLEHRGVALARTEHRWTRDRERATVQLRFTPPQAGTWALQVRLEGVSERGSADVRVLAEPRVLKIATYDTRPNWGATFVRRALEADPAFDVSALVRASRGVDVRAGAPPTSLTAETLNPYDLVLVGAPEELTRRDVDTLTDFVRRRGGSVVFLPDRKPSGPYLALVPAAGFDEVLLERPADLLAGERPPTRASELSIPREPGAGGEPMAWVQQGSATRPVVLSWPVGDGRVIFSGALDAWRYRTGEPGGFAAFWRSVAAAAALGSPRALEVTAAPGVAAPGETVVVRASLRRTELAERGTMTDAPPVGAELIDTATGTSRFLRLWPAAAAGEFEARFAAPAAGRYDVQVGVEGGAVAEVPLVVAAGAASPHRSEPDAVQFLAHATGGVVVDAAGIGPLEEHLRGLARPMVAAAVRPARSLWWMVAFVALACAEWVLRRHRGVR